MTEARLLRGFELRSLVTADGRLELSLQRVEVPEPGPDQIVVRVEATPVHPSDIGLLLGAADLTTLESKPGAAGGRLTSATVPDARIGLMASRIGLPLPVGNEGAGVVVKAGANVQVLLGKTVALAVGGMYAQYRLADTANCLVLPEGTTAAAGAAAFVNPLTALSFVETMRSEGYKAVVHTAAASALGQMLIRICAADDIPLVNIVRSAEQAAILHEIGARYVVDSSAPDFFAELTDAIAATGATVAFDAVGGGGLAGQILAAMESALSRNATAYSRYGSTTHKRVYIYGSLDVRPTIIDRSAVGMYWGVDSYMLGPFLEKIGKEGRKRLEARIAAELATTFASHFTAEISLAELLSPENLLAVARRATGEKYLVNPSLDPSHES